MNPVTTFRRALNVLIPALLFVCSQANASMFLCGIDKPNEGFQSASYDSVTGELKVRDKVIAKNPTIRREIKAKKKTFTFLNGQKELLRITQTSDQKGEITIGQLKSDRCYVVMSDRAAIQSPAEFCSTHERPKLFQDVLKVSENRLSFANKGGVMNIGTCWWHSRFERNAAYLAMYLPKEKKPSRAEALAIISAIRSGSQPVAIRGFANLAQFSHEYEADIQTAIEQWQISEGVLGGGWIEGLEGNYSESPEVLKRTMDQTYDLIVNKGRVAFWMLQLPGISAHAWLVLGMRKTKIGYSLEIADSLAPGSLRKVDYVNGISNFEYEGQPMVPYLKLNYTAEADKLMKVSRDYCAN